MGNSSRALLAAWLGLAALFFCREGRAEIRRAFVATADTNVYSVPSGNNGGAAINLTVGRVGPAPNPCDSTGVGNVCGAIRRSYLRFNLSGIPPGSVVTAARLDLSYELGAFSNAGVVTVPIALRRLLGTWVEGAGGGPAEIAATLGSVSPGGVTWTSGVSMAAADTAVAPVRNDLAAGTVVTWTSPRLTREVQRWVDAPATNFGWAIIGDESAPRTMRRFASREHPDAFKRPMLVVTYSLPNGTACSPDGPSPLCHAGYCASGVCGGTLIPFTRSLSPAEDAVIYSHGSTFNGGSTPELLAGRVGTVGCTGVTPNTCATIKRSLLRFNVTSVPVGSTVAGAVVRLTLLNGSNEPTTGRLVKFSRLTAGWTEGTGGAGDFRTSALGSVVPAGGGATWEFANQGVTPWTSGSSYVAAVSAQAFVTNHNSGPILYSWSAGRLRNDVQAWVNGPATNFGWVILGDESVPNTTRRFASRSHAVPAERPRLDVTYTLAAGAVCAPPGVNPTCTSGTCSSTGICN
jgi:hypothetical protein